MLLRPAVALRGLECASSLQCFGDTPAREQTPPLCLLARDFKSDGAVKVLSLAGDLQVPVNRWWWRLKLVLISDKTHGRLQEVKKTPGFYREIFHCDSNFFLPTIAIMHFRWRMVSWLLSNIEPFFLRLQMPLFLIRLNQGFCWKTVIYQWWVQPCIGKIGESSFTALVKKELPFEGKMMKHSP